MVIAAVAGQPREDVGQSAANVLTDGDQLVVVLRVVVEYIRFIAHL